MCGFRQKYISSDNWPILLVETEHFMNLCLLPHKQIEDYYSKIMDKGRRIHKTAQDILLKFIERLPPQLRFFVRVETQKMLTASMLGEAYGYRASLSSSSLTTTQHHQNQPNDILLKKYNLHLSRFFFLLQSFILLCLHGFWDISVTVYNVSVTLSHALSK